MYLYSLNSNVRATDHWDNQYHSVSVKAFAPDRAGAQDMGDDQRPQLSIQRYSVSAWTNSAAKRFFDCVVILLALPLVLPILMITAFFVRMTSRGPVFFIQQRIGMHGKPFKIFKFRSLEHIDAARRNAVTTSENQKFTPIGKFLRRYKLDELPQLINVLKGDMSLVGPRPKMPEHVKVALPCRPGVTGLATLMFAREEQALSRLPYEYLEGFYHDVALPTKRAVDRRYMAAATIWDDLRLLFQTVVRNWNASILNRLVDEYMESMSLKETAPPSTHNKPTVVSSSIRLPHGVSFVAASKETAIG